MSLLGVAGDKAYTEDIKHCGCHKARAVERLDSIISDVSRAHSYREARFSFRDRKLWASTLNCCSPTWNEVDNCALWKSWRQIYTLVYNRKCPSNWFWSCPAFWVSLRDLWLQPLWVNARLMISIAGSEYWVKIRTMPMRLWWLLRERTISMEVMYYLDFIVLIMDETEKFVT